LTQSSGVQLTLPISSGTVAVAAPAVISWGGVALYARYVVSLIKVRADLVMGSESQFVDHIIRYRAAQPQYTKAEDANISAYTTGSPLLTYLFRRHRLQQRLASVTSLGGRRFTSGNLPC